MTTRAPGAFSRDPPDSRKALLMRHATWLVLAVTVSLVIGQAALAPAPSRAENPALTVTVSHDAPGGQAEFGSTVRFIYTVRNSGDETLTAISVDDEWAGHVGDVAVLAPGDERAFTRAITIEGSIGGAGTTTASAMSEGGSAVSASAGYEIEVFIADQFADFAVTKRLVGGDRVPGGRLVYRLVITNVDGVAPDPDAPRLRVVDDYDERLARVTDAGGGSASLGTLVWDIAAPGPGDAPVVLEYELLLDSDAAGAFVNEARIDNPLDPESANDAATVRIVVTPPTTPAIGDDDPADAADDAESGGTTSGTAAGDEPFLPFTGAPLLPTLPIAAGFALLGAALRRASR